VSPGHKSTLGSRNVKLTEGVTTLPMTVMGEGTYKLFKPENFIKKPPENRGYYILSFRDSTKKKRGNERRV